MLLLLVVLLMLLLTLMCFWCCCYLLVPTFIQMLTRFSRHAPRRSERSERSAFVLLTYHLLITYLLLPCACLCCSCACLYLFVLAYACLCSPVLALALARNIPYSSSLIWFLLKSLHLNALPGHCQSGFFFCFFLFFCGVVFGVVLSSLLDASKRVLEPKMASTWVDFGAMLEPCWSIFMCCFGFSS